MEDLTKNEIMILDHQDVSLNDYYKPHVAITYSYTIDVLKEVNSKMSFPNNVILEKIEELENALTKIN